MIIIKPQKTLAFADNEENNDLWYLGKGAKQNMYVKYNIQDNYVNNGNPYEMTIYFKEYDSNRQYWNATISVVYNGKIITDDFHLANDDLHILSDSKVSDEMKPYKESYSRTLDSLALVAGKPGQSLSAAWWCAGFTVQSCALEVEPGMKNVNVTAGTFLCKVLTAQQYETYVNQDIPYPIQHRIGTGGMITNSEIFSYKYELLEIGQGYETIPEFPLAIPILLVSILSTLVFYRMESNFRT